MFSETLIQAVSDWQRSGDNKQKAKRGLALKAAAENLPLRFRTTDTVCYRQIALSELSLLRLGSTLELPETISSWTMSEHVARDFLGGVPPVGHGIGVVLRIQPPPKSVVLNFSVLLTDKEFLAAVEEYKSRIAGLANGLGKWGNSQQEVVIEMDSIPIESVYAWGGYSRQKNELAEIACGHKPSPQELEEFSSLFDKSGLKVGQYWLCTPDATERIRQKLVAESHRR